MHRGLKCNHKRYLDRLTLEGLTQGGFHQLRELFETLEASKIGDFLNSLKRYCFGDLARSLDRSPGPKNSKLDVQSCAAPKIQRTAPKGDRKRDPPAARYPNERVGNDANPMRNLWPEPDDATAIAADRPELDAAPRRALPAPFPGTEARDRRVRQARNSENTRIRKSR